MVAASPEEGFCEDNSITHTLTYTHVLTRTHTCTHSHKHTLREHQSWACRCTGSICDVTAPQPREAGDGASPLLSRLPGGLHCVLSNGCETDPPAGSSTSPLLGAAPWLL